MPKQGRVKVKKIMPKGSEEDTNVLNDMFEQMTGSQGADLEIIIPKLTRIHNLLTKFIKIYNLLLNFNDFIDKFQEYNKEFDDQNAEQTVEQIKVAEKQKECDALTSGCEGS